MNISLQITSLSILSEPFLPFSSKKLKQILNLSNSSWDDAGFENLSPGKINKSQLLFFKNRR